MPKQEAVALHSAVKRSLEKFISHDHFVAAALKQLDLFPAKKIDDLLAAAAQSSQTSLVDHDHVISYHGDRLDFGSLQPYCYCFCFIS